MALGAAGLALRLAPLPPVLSFDLAKALLVLTSAASWTAARAFTGRPPRWLPALAGAGLWLLACRIPGFRDTDAAQMALSCALGAGYTLATAVALTAARAERLRLLPAALVLLGGHAALYAARAVLAATGLDVAIEPALTTAMLLEAQLHTVGMAFILVALTKQRTENQLAASRDAAHQANETRRRFVAAMSHEVRTPLNGVLGITALMRRDPDLTANQRAHLDVLEGAGRHLLAIVNDALDLAKIDADRLDIAADPLDPAAAGEACLALVRPAAIDRRIVPRLVLDPALPPLVAGDATRLQQILLNLLWNAVKTTPEGGSVTLRLSAADGLVAEVTDTGRGIPPDKRGQLFKDFARIEPSTEGTGLGLSLSARLAQRMGGRLAYQPGPGNHGSIFRLTLPWPAIAPPAPRPLHVLLLDPELAHRRQLRAFLLFEGHQVTEAAGPGPFDAVLADAPPGELAALRAAHPATPLVALTADPTPEYHAACLEAGASRVLTRPLDRAQVMDSLRRLTAAAPGAMSHPAASGRQR